MNRRADEKTAPMVIILALIVLLVLMFLNVIKLGDIVKSSLPFFYDCEKDFLAERGQCIVGSCSQIGTSEIVYSESLASCKSKGQTCCVFDKALSVGTPPALDPRCEGKVLGDSCADYMLCNNGLDCVSKCEYCAGNPQAPGCSPLIGDVIGKKFGGFDDKYNCGCAAAECKSGNDFTCILKMCPGTNPQSTDYRCCNK